MSPALFLLFRTLKNQKRTNNNHCNSQKYHINHRPNSFFIYGSIIALVIHAYLNIAPIKTRFPTFSAYGLHFKCPHYLSNSYCRIQTIGGCSGTFIKEFFKAGM